MSSRKCRRRRVYSNKESKIRLSRTSRGTPPPTPHASSQEGTNPPPSAPSLPLDIGHSSTIPAAIRTAVILRDQHCQWAGGCDQPAAACEVHHLVHKANGGKTSVKTCGLYCSYHHETMIHRRGWTVTLNPDGTTARSPDGTKVFRSHSPPARPG